MIRKIAVASIVGNMVFYKVKGQTDKQFTDQIQSLADRLQRMLEKANVGHAFSSKGQVFTFDDDLDSDGFNDSGFKFDPDGDSGWEPDTEDA